MTRKDKMTKSYMLFDWMSENINVALFLIAFLSLINFILCFTNDSVVQLVQIMNNFFIIFFAVLLIITKYRGENKNFK